MSRSLTILVTAGWLAIGPPPEARAQDVPLSQILPPDGRWVKSKEPPFRPHNLPGALVNKPAHADRVPRGPWFMTLPDKKGVFRVTEDGAWLSHVPLERATGVAVWPDGGTVVIADGAGKHLWAFRIGRDHSLTDGDPYYELLTRPEEKCCQVGGLAVDPLGRLYAATNLGVQIFDPTGRLSGVLLKPCDGELTHVRVFPGDRPILSVLCGGTRYDRPLRPFGP